MSLHIFCLDLQPASLLHFLSLRLPEDSQWEIRAYADHMAEIAEPIVPEAFDAFYENGQTF